MREKQAGVLGVLARQTLLLIGTFGVIRIVSVGSTLYLSRRWGPIIYGDFFTLSSVAVLISVVLNAGLEQYLVRELVQRTRDGDLLAGDVLLLKAGITALGVLALGVLALLGGRPALLAAGGYALSYSVLLLGYAACRGVDRVRMQAGVQIVHAALLAAGSAALAHYAYGVVAVLWLALAVTLVCLSGLAWRLRGQLRLRWYVRPALWDHVRPALAIGLSAIVLLALDRLLLTGLAWFNSRAVVGWFGASYNLVQLWSALPALAMSVALPLLARAAADPATFRRLAFQLLGLGLGGAALAALGLAILATPLIRLLYGVAYAPAAPLLRWLAWSLPASTGLLVMINILNAAGAQAECVRVLRAGFPLSVGLIWGCAALGPAPGIAAYSLVQWMLLGLLGRRALAIARVRPVPTAPAP